MNSWNNSTKRIGNFSYNSWFLSSSYSQSFLSFKRRYSISTLPFMTLSFNSFFICLIFCFHKIQFKLEYDKSEEKASKINDFCSYVYRRTVPSAPEENSHGCVGCQTTSNTPRSSCGLCAWSFLSGTINGFCSKSLKILNENKLFFSFLNVRQTLNLCWLTCTPFRVTQ